MKDGVVLAVEKLIHSKLLVPEANRRIQTIDKHIGLVRRASLAFSIQTLTAPTIMQASAGYLADGRHVSNRARDEASSFRENYRAPATLQVRITCIPMLLGSLIIYSNSTLWTV